MASRTPSLEELSAAVVGRESGLFDSDTAANTHRLDEQIREKKILVVGGAGSIGSYTIRAIARHHPASLHVVDINENGLADLVRQLRGAPDWQPMDDFRTIPLDFGSPIMRRLLVDEKNYDIVLNFAAVKHVRSEKDVFSLLHMLDTNVVKAARLLRWLGEVDFAGRYFSVSTDKAANPVNAMGTTKRIMEMVTFSRSFLPQESVASSARFANVAFSNGSLLASFLQRLAARHPLAAPKGARRFFITLPEAGDICALAGALAPDSTILVPMLTSPDLIEVSHVAEVVLREYDLEPKFYDDENAAKRSVTADLARNQYPLLLTPLDTSGEKPYEEFLGADETLEASPFTALGVVRPASIPDDALAEFVQRVERVIEEPRRTVTKDDLLGWMAEVVPFFEHVETGRSLDHRL